MGVTYTSNPPLQSVICLCFLTDCLWLQWVEDIKPASPYYCDPIDDNTRFAFEAVPERLFILLDGKVVYRGGAISFNFSPMFGHSRLSSVVFWSLG